jgi:redox-sensitive bicupin YhaK (pirin superfamily)
MLDHIGPEKLADDFYVDGHMHPHRGFETLTMMFEGIMYHVDTSGYREELNTGSTQNMVAGSGIQHGGDMAADVDTNVFHEVQLWVNMPAATKMQPPSISSARSGEKPILDRGHYSIEVIAGSVDDYLSPLSTTQPTTVLRVRTSGEGPISIGEISPAWNAMSYALQGSFRVGDRLVEEYETVLFNNDGDTLDLRSIGAGADVLVLAGEPIGEPVAVGALL